MIKNYKLFVLQSTLREKILQNFVVLFYVDDGWFTK